MIPEFKMNPDVKEQWLAALRSGDYDQGVGVLAEVGGGFCCLGVLCDLAVKAGVIPEPTVVRGVEANDGPIDAYAYGLPEEADPENCVAYLPVEVQAWSGVSRYGDRDFGLTSLSVVNDEGKTFAHIADIIETEF